MNDHERDEEHNISLEINNASTMNKDFTSDITNHMELPRKKKSRLQELSSTVQQLQKLNETINTESKPNEYEIFGKHVASQLEKLSTENAIIGQEKIQSILTQLRLNEIISNVPNICYARQDITCSTPMSSLDSTSSSTYISAPDHYNISNINGNCNSDVLATAIANSFENLNN